MKLLKEVNADTQLNEAFRGSEEEELAQVENVVKAAGFTPGTDRYKRLVSYLMISREDDPSTFNRAIEGD